MSKENDVDSLEAKIATDKDYKIDLKDDWVQTKVSSVSKPTKDFDGNPAILVKTPDSK